MLPHEPLLGMDRCLWCGGCTTDGSRCPVLGQDRMMAMQAIVKAPDGPLISLDDYLLPVPDAIVEAP